MVYYIVQKRKEEKMKKRNFVLRGFNAFTLAERICSRNYKIAPLAGETARSAKGGFTLAEVLITLVVIGVIGALTVPSLIQNTQKQEYVTALKKAHSTLSQVTQQIIAEEGSPKNGWADTAEHVYNLYKQHLNVSKACGTGGGCFPESYRQLYGDGRHNWDGWTSLYKLILADGMRLIVDSDGNTSAECGISTRGGSNNVCAFILIDINGAKGPNRMAHDLFEFVIKEDGLHPSGCDRNGCTNDNFGRGCACKVLTEGAVNY